MASTANAARGGRTRGFVTVAAMVAVMWLVELVDAIDHHRLDTEGIVARDVSRLPGIVFAPFLHASFGHLLANTIPLVALGLAIALEGAARVLAVSLLVGLIGGFGTWLTAPSSTVTVGASGLVFGYGAYLLARGIFSRRPFQLAVGAIVGVVFGGALLGGLVPHSGISWQGHLFGSIGGLLAARLLTSPAGSARRRPGPASR